MSPAAPRPYSRARLAVALLAVALLAGCAPRQAPRTEPAPAAGPRADTVWYVSARARDREGRDTRLLADSMEYGLAIARVDGSADALRRDVDLAIVDSVRMTATEFASALRIRARASGDTAADGRDSLVVLMVHGFGTGLHEAWDYAAQARVRSRSAAPWVVFAWPSNGSGVAWPRAGQLLVRAYREDSASAVASRPSFSRLLTVLLAELDGSQLLVVAHSLGSQLVGESLATDGPLRSLLTARPLRAIAYFAPDVATSRFTDTLLPATATAARRVVVYGSTNDRLLTVSRAVNRSERAGLLRGPLRATDGMELVDVTRGLSAENPLQRLVGSHHALRRASAALFDLVGVVGRELPAGCRTTLGTAALDVNGIWRLTAMPPPALSATSACRSP